MSLHIDYRRGALLVRLADAPAPEIALWRGLLIAVSLTLVVYSWVALR